MANRTFTCRDTNEKINLPPNLYPYSTTKSDMYGKWIYKHPEGKRTLHKCIGDNLPNKIPAPLAVELAEALNEKHYGSHKSDVDSPQVHKVGYVPYEINKYIKYHEKTYPRSIKTTRSGRKVPSSHWQAQRSLLLRFADYFGTARIEKLQYKKVRAWWMNPDIHTHHTQHRACSVLFKMFDAWCLDDPRFVLLFSRSGARLPTVEKQRSRLKASHFEAIRNFALKSNEMALVNAMDIALLTMLRRANVVDLKFTDIIEDKLEVELVKKKIKTTFVFDLKDEMNKPLLNVITRCRLSRFDVVKGDIKEPALNIVHKNYEHPKAGESKIHLSSLNPHQLSKLFKKYRDMAYDVNGRLLFEDVPLEERPSFHEIRSLGCFTAIKRGAPIEVVSMLMGHDDVKTTKAFYANGHEDVIVEAQCLNEGVAA